MNQVKKKKRTVSDPCSCFMLCVLYVMDDLYFLCVFLELSMNHNH